MTNSVDPGFDKAALVGALGAEWGEIAELCARLDEAEWDLPTECPGWSVRDNLAHVIGTELMLTGESSPDIELQDAVHIKNPIGENNEKWIEARRGSPGADVLAEFETVTQGRLDTLGAMSQADFDAPSWTPAGDATFGRMMRIRLFDSWMHDQDIRQATGREGNLGGDHVALALDEIVTSMGYVVGKLGAAPDGARVQIDLTGPTSLTINVEIEGRARLVDSLGGEPTIGIRMPTLLFTRLCGGRTSPDEALAAGVIELSGDLEAAERIVTNLAFMI